MGLHLQGSTRMGVLVFAVILAVAHAQTHGPMEGDMTHGPMEGDMTHGAMEGEMTHGAMEGDMTHGDMEATHAPMEETHPPMEGTHPPMEETHPPMEPTEGERPVELPEPKPECCDEKTVGSITYYLVGTGETEYYNCLDNCIYHSRNPRDVNQYCF